MVLRLENQAVTAPNFLGTGDLEAFGVGLAPGRKHTQAVAASGSIALLP